MSLNNTVLSCACITRPRSPYPSSVKFSLSARAQLRDKSSQLAGTWQPGPCVCRSMEAVMTQRLHSQWSWFEANHPAQRKLGFLVLLIAELEERHGAHGCIS